MFLKAKGMKICKTILTFFFGALVGCLEIASEISTDRVFFWQAQVRDPRARTDRAPRTRALGAARRRGRVRVQVGRHSKEDREPAHRADGGDLGFVCGTTRVPRDA